MFEVGVGSWTMQSSYMSPRPFGEIYREARHHIRLAEELGFDSFDIGEHHNAYDGYLPSSMAVAAGLLASTSSIRTSLAVLLLPLQGAERVAEGISAINAIAPGRLRIIAGLGWRDIEYDTSDVVRKQRGRIMDAYSDLLIDGALADRARGAEFWFGGGAPATLRRAARLGASFCHTFSPVNVLAERIELWRRELAPARPGQRAPKSTFTIDMWVDRNPERCAWIRERMREPWRFYASMDSLPDDVTGNPVGVEQTVDMLASYSIVGSPEEAIEQLAPYVRICDGVVCRIWCDGVETALADECLTLLGREVAPALRRMK